MKWKLPYWLQNTGDGSASLKLCETLDDAEKASDNHNDGGDGFSENTANEITIEVIDGVPYFNHEWWNMKKKVWVEKLVPLIAEK